MDRNKTKYAAKICGIMPCSHIHIKPAYGNGEIDSLCGKICDTHTFGKYANNATIACSHKTGMPNCNLGSSAMKGQINTWEFHCLESDHL